jgi:hypothetical protein
MWLGVLPWAWAEQSKPLPPRVFAQPDRIRYDHQCLTIDGKDVFVYSGAFHYFRCPKALWSARFQKIQEAGFNAVETYVPWNWSERRPPAGLEDFSGVDLSELEEWLTMAEGYGLNTIVRPGPYICAEWSGGGFPEWLLARKPERPLRAEGWLRSDDPVYLAWCRHWYEAVCPVIARHQITRKAPGQPGVILVQVENEYDFGPAFSQQTKVNQLKALVDYARAGGVEVPLFTCWTRQVRGATDPALRQVFDMFNCYPRWEVDGAGKDIAKLRQDQPDAPLGTAELQGGWFAKIGGILSESQEGITASQINNLTLFAIQHGETVLNYYMLFGGSNPGDWGGRSQISSYDYNAPIREWGGVGERYQRVLAIGRMLREHGSRLARAELIACEARAGQGDVAVAVRRAPDGSRYVFVRTSQHSEARDGTAIVRGVGGDLDGFKFDYHLEPFGSKVLYLPPGATGADAGEWLPKAVPVLERPPTGAAPVVLTTAKCRVDPGPSKWQGLKGSSNLVQAGVFDSRFVFYQVILTNPVATNLQLKYPFDDAVVAGVNGRLVAREWGDRGSSVFALPAGVAQVRLLYENRGFANGRKEMEQPGGISAAQVVSELQARPIGGWRMREVEDRADFPETRPEFDDAGWKPVSTESVEASFTPPAGSPGASGRAGTVAVFRARFQMGTQDLKGERWNLGFGRIEEAGQVYVNGKSVGRTADRTRAHSFEVTRELHPGANVVAVVVRSQTGSVGLGAPTLSRGFNGEPVSLQALGFPKGIEEEWWRPQLNDAGWETVAVGRQMSGEAGELTWFRLGFELPAANPEVWFPWRVHLEASGNGFLYLNGHALGRYWEAGPQHDFFLPECWLNFGRGQSNNLTLSLRPVGERVRIQKAVVEPYVDYSEKATTAGYQRNGL